MEKMFLMHVKDYFLIGFFCGIGLGIVFRFARALKEAKGVSKKTSDKFFEVFLILLCFWWLIIPLIGGLDLCPEVLVCLVMSTTLYTTCHIMYLLIDGIKVIIYWIDRSILLIQKMKKIAEASAKSQ